MGPVYWLWHNWAIYGDAFEFLTGPNSARGIYLQNRINFGWSTIFVGHAGLDVLVMVAATAVCAGPLILLLSVAGLAIALVVKTEVIASTLAADLAGSAVLLSRLQPVPRRDSGFPAKRFRAAQYPIRLAARARRGVVCARGGSRFQRNGSDDGPWSSCALISHRRNTGY